VDFLVRNMKQWSNLLNINDLKRLWIGGQIETP